MLFLYLNLSCVDNNNIGLNSLYSILCKKVWLIMDLSCLYNKGRLRGFPNKPMSVSVLDDYHLGNYIQS